MAQKFCRRAGVGWLRGGPAIPEAVEDEFRSLRDAVETDNETWKHLLPGRAILKMFAAKAKIEVGTLKRLYIKCAQGHERNPFLDVRNIFDGFAKFDSNQNESAAQQGAAADAALRRG